MHATRRHSNNPAPVLFVVLDLSKSKWHLAMSDGLGRPACEGTVTAASIRELRQKVAKFLHKLGLSASTRVVVGYEAGRDGFWLHRAINGRRDSWECQVIDPASIQVSRRGRQAKTDRVDAEKLLTAMIRRLQGDRHACRFVHPPSPEAEDTRQVNRELNVLKKERTQHLSRIKSLLFAQGIEADVRRNFLDELPKLGTGDGRRLPPHLQAALTREFRRLQLVVEQIREVEKSCADLFRQADSSPESCPVHVRMAGQLRQLCGIGEIGSWTLATEVFASRSIKNRRQLAALAGLTPTPYASGERFQDQGISKSGRAELRRLMVELAWCWVHFQPNSQLTRWFQERFGRGGKRQRRIGIVALARKLLISLWKYACFGELPADAEFAKHPERYKYTPSLS